MEVKTRTTKGQMPRSVAYDYLVMDGGWLTADGLALHSGVKPSGIRKIINRWERNGWVESRERKLGSIRDFRGTREYKAVRLNEYYIEEE